MGIQSVAIINSQYAILFSVIVANLFALSNNSKMFPFWFIGNNWLKKILTFLVSTIISTMLIYMIMVNLLDINVNTDTFLKQATITMSIMITFNTSNIGNLIKYLLKYTNNEG